MIKHSQMVRHVWDLDIEQVRKIGPGESGPLQSFQNAYSRWIREGFEVLRALLGVIAFARVLLAPVFRCGHLRFTDPVCRSTPLSFYASWPVSPSLNAYSRLGKLAEAGMPSRW